MLFNFPKKNIRKFGKSPARLIVDETFGVDAELKKLVESGGGLCFFTKFIWIAGNFVLTLQGKGKDCNP